MNDRQQSWTHRHTLTIIVALSILLTAMILLWLKTTPRAIDGVNTKAYAPISEDTTFVPGAINPVSVPPAPGPSQKYQDLSKFDINGDGKADYNDAKFIASFVAGVGTECPVAKCDISGDGQVNSQDASRLAKALIKAYDLNLDRRFTTADPKFIATSVAKGNTKTVCPVYTCDISGNGQVTSQDATQLAKILETFPK